MRISHAMTREIHAIEPTSSVAQAAHLMAERDVGVLPVVEDDKLVGILTDRDIALRAYFNGTHSGTPVLRLMTLDVHTCNEDEEIEKVLARMGAMRVRRMPVLGSAGELVGMVSISDIAQCSVERDELTNALAEISRRKDSA